MHTTTRHEVSGVGPRCQISCLGRRLGRPQSHALRRWRLAQRIFKPRAAFCKSCQSGHLPKAKQCGRSSVIALSVAAEGTTILPAPALVQHGPALLATSQDQGFVIMTTAVFFSIAPYPSPYARSLTEYYWRRCVGCRRQLCDARGRTGIWYLQLSAS